MHKSRYQLTAVLFSVIFLTVVFLALWSGASSSSATDYLTAKERASTATLTELPVAAGHSSTLGQARCSAAVKAVQDAVNEQAYATAEMRRAMCELGSLSPEMREGRPKAIYDARMRNFQAAQKKTSAAYTNARGCDTTRVHRPEITDYDPAATDLTIACYARHQLRGAGPGSIAECDRLLQNLNCGAIKVVEPERPPTDETPVTIPEGLKPECRDAYLKFKAAEKDYQRAEKHYHDIATSGYGAAGPRGTAMLNAARKDQQTASAALSEARARLDRCTAEAPKTGCNGFAGTWKTDFGTMTFALTGGNQVHADYDFDGGSVTGTISGDGRTMTGTYSENKAKGSFRFTLAADGKSFSGTWNRTSGTREPPTGTWSGKCVVQ
jgi:hypothetical protein